MKFSNALLAIALLAAVTTSAIAETVAHRMEKDPGWDPADSDQHVAYEWSTFDVQNPAAHAPGAVLSAPGDMYSYTVLMADEFALDPDYEIVRASIGIHIDDSDPSNPGRKWGRIEVNGAVHPFVIFSKNDTRTPSDTDLVEIISDATLTGRPGSSMPPYIFDIKQELDAGRNVRISIINLRQDGTLDSEAPFGGFVVNRVGAHVWYKKR